MPCRLKNVFNAFGRQIAFLSFERSEVCQNPFVNSVLTYSDGCESIIERDRPRYFGRLSTPHPCQVPVQLVI